MKIFNKKFKVIFYYSSLRMGGAERIISILANQLSKKGIKVSIITVSNDVSVYKLDSKVDHIILNQKEVIVGNKVTRRIKRISNLKNVLYEKEPNIVIAFGVPYLIDLLLVKRKQNFKIIGSERANPYNNTNIYSTWKKKIVSLLTDGYIFSTDYSKRFYPKKVQKNSIIIPNPLSEEFLTKEYKPESDLNYKIISVGRLEKVKDFPTLIYAFELFYKEHPTFTLEIYGDGSQRDHLKKIIEERKLEKKVFLMGKTPNVKEKLLTSSVFVLSSISEGYPNSLIEALATGLPVITTHYSSSVHEIITNYENGIIIPPKNPFLLKEALNEIVNDSNLASEMSKNAIKIKDRNNVDELTNILMEFLERMFSD